MRIKNEKRHSVSKTEGKLRRPLAFERNPRTCGLTKIPGGKEPGVRGGCTGSIEGLLDIRIARY